MAPCTSRFPGTGGGSQRTGHQNGLLIQSLTSQVCLDALQSTACMSLDHGVDGSAGFCYDHTVIVPLCVFWSCAMGRHMRGRTRWSLQVDLSKLK